MLNQDNVLTPRTLPNEQKLGKRTHVNQAYNDVVHGAHTQRETRAASLRSRERKAQ